MKWVAIGSVVFLMVVLTLGAMQMLLARPSRSVERPSLSVSREVGVNVVRRLHVSYSDFSGEPYGVAEIAVGSMLVKLDLTPDEAKQVLSGDFAAAAQRAKDAVAAAAK